MARFSMELPTEIMEDVQRLNGDAGRIFGEMTRAGAEAAAANVRAAAPLPEIAEGVKLSVTYRTPSDGGINTKVYISGYAGARKGRVGEHTEFIHENRTFTRRGRVGGDQYTTSGGIPCSFLAMVYEYGTSPRFTNAGAYRGYIGKKPFFRKSFKKAQIERIMLAVQKRESGGLLDE